MKVITIKVRSIIREIIIWIVLFGAAFYTNIYAIRKFEAPWEELWSQIHVVFILSAVYFVIFAIVRLILYALYIPVRKYVVPAIANYRNK